MEYAIRKMVYVNVMKIFMVLIVDFKNAIMIVMEMDYVICLLEHVYAIVVFQEIIVINDYAF